MSKFLIYGDVHCHPHRKSGERLKDCLKALEWTFLTAKERKIENILFLGDLFQDREKIDVLTYQRVFELFEKYVSNDLKTYLLLGNHDIWHAQRMDISSVLPLRTIPGVTVIDKPCTINIDDFPVSFLPYTNNPTEDIKLIKNNSKFKFLCGHVAVDGAIYNVMAQIYANVEIEQDGDMIKVSSNIFESWDRVFLGHYHAQQKLDYNVEYIGSPLQLSFGEAFQHKHIVVFDTETHDIEYIRNKFSPQYFIIPVEDAGKYEAKGNYFHIVVEDGASEINVIDVRRELLSKGAVFIKFTYTHKKVEAEVIQSANAILFKESEMLTEYLKTQKDTELDKDKLLKIGKKIISVEVSE